MADKNDFSELLAEMLIRMDRQQEEIRTTNSILNTVVDVQTRMLQQMERTYDYQEGVNTRQERFNERQEQFNERQQQFNERQQQHNEQQQQFNERQEKLNERQEEVNLAILQELRIIKTDVRELKEIAFNNHEERLRRLEEFMRRAG